MARIKKADFKIDTEEMTRAGVNFGHRTSRIHPKMKPYLFGVRNTCKVLPNPEIPQEF